MISLQFAYPPHSAKKLVTELQKHHSFAPVLFENQPFSLKEEVMSNGLCLIPLVSETKLELSTAHPLSKFFIEPLNYRTFQLAPDHQQKDIINLLKNSVVPSIHHIIKKPIGYGLIDKTVEFIVVEKNQSILICPLFEFKRLWSNFFPVPLVQEIFETSASFIYSGDIQFIFRYLPKQLGIFVKIFPDF
jgi:hypothetical protein